MDIGRSRSHQADVRGEDNAIVNANKLDTMAQVWRRRFLTWGILIAVFGIRIVFPLSVVIIADGIGPWDAIRFAAATPEDYARIMEAAHLSITAFGGTIPENGGAGFFIDDEEEVVWIGACVARPGCRGCRSVWCCWCW